MSDRKHRNRTVVNACICEEVRIFFQAVSLRDREYMHLAATCLRVISQCNVGWCVLLAEDREHRHLTLLSPHIMSKCDDVWCVLAA